VTAIAYRDGTLAADTASWHAGVLHAHVRKIVKLPDGTLFAGCGPAECIEAYVAWRKDESANERPAPPDKEDEFSGILIAPDGRVRYVEGLYVPYDAGVCPFHALGAHAEFLYGAMAAGASAPEAVRLCIALCENAGGSIQVERLDSTLEP
jgi:hypothetical protein